MLTQVAGDTTPAAVASRAQHSGEVARSATRNVAAKMVVNVNNDAANVGTAADQLARRAAAVAAAGKVINNTDVRLTSIEKARAAGGTNVDATAITAIKAQAIRSKAVADGVAAVITADAAATSKVFAGAVAVGANTAAIALVANFEEAVKCCQFHCCHRSCS